MKPRGKEKNCSFFLGRSKSHPWKTDDRFYKVSLSGSLFLPWTDQAVEKLKASLRHEYKAHSGIVIYHFKVKELEFARKIVSSETRKFVIFFFITLFIWGTLEQSSSLLETWLPVKLSTLCSFAYAALVCIYYFFTKHFPWVFFHKTNTVNWMSIFNYFLQFKRKWNKNLWLN